jgi:hypothetical protein
MLSGKAKMLRSRWHDMGDRLMEFFQVSCHIPFHFDQFSVILALKQIS